MKVSREFLQKVVRQEYRKLLSENIDDMQDMDTDMNMFGSGYEASETDDEHIHDENCGHDYETDETEHDDESQMFRSHLTSITKQVEELESLVQQGDNVEEWVQEKMAVAASMIDSIYHYLSHGEESSEETDDYDDEYDDEMDDDETDEYDDDEY